MRSGETAGAAPRAETGDDERSLAGWFEARATTTPDRPALTFEGRTATFGEIRARVLALAGALRDGGVGAGDRVAFLGFNQPAFLDTLFATAALGAVFVPVNFRLTPAETRYVLEHAGVHTLVADEPHRPTVDALGDELALARRLAVEGPAAGWEPLPAAVDAATPLERPAPVDCGEPALIMYTSGTTGYPKGAVLTHRNLWWNGVNTLCTMDLAYDDVTLTVAPLFHIGGLNVITLPTWLKGGHVVLQRNFDPGGALEAIGASGVTTIFAVPSIYNALAKHERFAATDLSSLRLLVCGGAPLPLALVETYLEHGVDLLQGYGLTETGPTCAFLTAEHALDKLGSAGRAPLFCELRIAGPDGETLTEPGSRGEICVRGPNVMPGYWRDPEGTAAAIDADGWFHTGDAGYRDADGFFYVTDRIKDMVISGGENVYPAEVEAALFDHPAVAEVAVIGMPDERWGETVVAVVALRAGARAPTLEQLREHAGGRLARYKLPRRLEVVAELPRNPSGKVLKRELRERFAG